MTTKTEFNFDGVKKEIFRAKQKVLGKMGKASQTVDVVFNQERERFEAKHKLLRGLMKSIETYEKCIRDLSMAQANLAENIAALYEGQSELYNACLINQNVTCEIDACRIDLEENLKTHVKGPMADHLAQYDILQDRISERGRRRIDMDRYRSDLDRAIKKEPQHKIAGAREKAEKMTSAYNEINGELIADFPKLLDDRFLFFDPLFCTIVDNQSIFFKKCGETFDQLTPYMEHIDRLSYLNHTSVITPEEETCYAKPLELASGPTVLVSAALPAPASASRLALPGPAGASSSPSPNPQPVASGGPVSLAQAIYKFEAADGTELSFEAGDTIKVIKKHGEWWEGELNGNKGLFPSSYVSEA